MHNIHVLCSKSIKFVRKFYFLNVNSDFTSKPTLRLLLIRTRYFYDFSNPLLCIKSDKKLEEPSALWNICFLQSWHNLAEVIVTFWLLFHISTLLNMCEWQITISTHYEGMSSLSKALGKWRFVLRVLTIFTRHILDFLRKLLRYVLLYDNIEARTLFLL